jgi:glyoxylase-like metal-dependent hydrolase (beta-lactamase superfamily II)
MATLLPLQDGQVLDLGERKIEVIHMPGHTKGSICLLDRKNKLLFTGDNIKPLVWMHMEESVPLETYLNSLKKIQARNSEFTTLLPGHDDLVNKEFITDLITCVQDIIAGKCEGKPYESVVGNGLICNYKDAQVAYNPAKVLN